MFFFGTRPAKKRPPPTRRPGRKAGELASFMDTLGCREAVEKVMRAELGFGDDQVREILAFPVHLFRARNLGGMAHATFIRLNEALLNPGMEEPLREVFLHEVAHLLCAHAPRGLGGRGHGPGWRRMCLRLGIAPETHHQLGEAFAAHCGPAPNQMVFTCERCGFTRTYHRRVDTRRPRVHTRCGGAMKLTPP